MTRRNFRCCFNPYVTPENRDSVIKSVVAQFDGYFAEPEVTLTDNAEFVLSINITDVLPATLVRDKLLWNYFVESVSAQQIMNKVQILRLPKSSFVEQRPKGSGSVGGVGPWVDPDTQDTGVDEVDGNAHKEYKMDMGDRPDGPRFSSVFNSSLHYADPTGELIPGDLLDGKAKDLDVPEDLTDMHKEAFQSDTGGSFQLSKGNQYGISLDQEEIPTQNEGFVPPGNLYNTKDEKGSRTGVEFAKRGDEASAAPINGINPTASKKDEASDEEVVADSLDIPRAKGGMGNIVPGDEGITAWTSSAHFGLNDHYSYESEINDDYYF